MANFDVVEYGYDIADETINFGTRALADGSNLHEAATLATLKCSGEAVETSPQISAITRNGRVYFTVDKTMRVFKDKGCSEVIFNVMFDCQIETFTLASDGSYLLICLESGLVHMLDCNTDDFNCVSTQSVFDLDDSSSFVGSFPESSEDDTHRFLLILDSGKILRLTMEEDAVHVDVVQKLQSSIRNVALSYPFLLLNGTRLVCLNLEDTSVMYNDYGLLLKNIFPLYNSFLALDLSGRLLRICARTLIINYIDKSDEIFEDLLLLSDEEEDLIQLVGVTRSTDDQLNIQHLSYPEFSTIFSLKISSKVYLITPESINDEIMYISEICNGQKQINELRFYVVYETEAERRLQRLLRKKKFDEAEQFAKTFGMDMNKVAEAKAQIIVDKCVTDTDDIKTLFDLLNRIESDEFKVQSCVNVESSCTNLRDVRKILSFGCKVASKTKQEINQIWIDKATDLMSRCEVYLMIKKGKGYTMPEWVKFSTCDLSDELIYYLKNHKIEEALIILSLFTELTNYEFDRILKSLDSIPNDAYEVFLPTFVPFCFKYLARFAEWTTNKIFYFETRREFPDNAIRFAGLVIELLDRFSQDYSCKPDQNFSQLLNLMTALKCLKQLKDDFRIKAPISAYLAGPESFASTLLREMAPGNYDPFVKEFLFHFMMCHHLELNEILLNEIENVTMYEENYWIDIVGSIVNCMSSIDSKLKAVGTLLDMASVPWNDTIRNIANGVLQYSHPSVIEIKERLQNEPILVVLKRPKYEIKENSVNNMEDVRHFASRMIYCNEPTMIEDVYTLCKTPRQRHEVNMLLIRNFITKGELEKALKVLDNNSPQEILACARETFSMADLLIHSVDFNDPITCPKVTENYYKILGSIFERIKENSRDGIALEFDEETFHLLSGVFNLKKHFNFNTNTHYLRCNQTEVIDQVLEETLCKFETGKIGVSEVFAACNRISVHLGSDQDNVIVKFCTKVHNFDVILKAGQSLYENDSSSKNLCLIAVLLLKYLGEGSRCTVRLSESRCSSDGDSFGSCDNRNYSSGGVYYSEESLCDGLKLAEKLVAKALVCADPDDVSACMEVFSCVNMSFYVTNRENKALNKTLFGDTFPGGVMPGYSTFSAICNHFNLFCEFVANFNNPDRKFLTYFKQYGATPMSKETLLDELSMLPTTVESLCKEGQPYTAYKITNTLKYCLAATPNPDPAILKLLNSVLKKQCILRLLRDALNREVIDVDFLYNLLLSCDMDDAIKFVKDSLRSHKRCPTKFGCMALVGYRFWKHHELPGKSKIANIILSVKWWNKVQKVNLNYDKFFQVDALTRLDMLLMANCIGLELLEEYCIDFGLKSQSAYALYFKKTLCNWKPQYEIKTELGNKRKLAITSDESSLYNQCIKIADNINNKNLIFETINNIWNSINFYYYEVFMAIMNIMIYINPKSYDDQKMKMLVFLKDYQRVSEPGDMETQQYYTSFPDARTLDPLSEFRLPYTQSLFAKDVWNIIRPEINLKTYRIWFDVLTILRTYLNKDEICCYVVKAIVSSGILNPGTGDKKWVLYPQHAELLSEIDECVQNICDLEKTTSAIYHLMSNTANGADQVNAARLCHKYALQYKRDNPGSNDVELAFTKVEKKYHMYSAMHILYTHQLAEERYLNLVTNPQSLIMSLYSDERIISKELISHQCPDINAATTALAELFELNIEKKRFDLINQWILDQDSTSSDFDASLFANETLIDSQNSCASDNNNVIKRSAYICNGNEFLRNYLLKIGTHENSEYSVDCKVRALKVFAFVSDDATITKLTDLSPDEFKNWIDKLAAVSMLQNLGVCLDTSILDKSSKKELLSRLMKRPENALLIATMALICTTYTMYDLKYWEYILVKAVKLQMHSAMKNYLDFLKNQKFNHKSFYVRAWQSYVDHLFTYIDSLKDAEQFDVLVNNFLLIQACPVKHSLKFEYVLRKCKNAGRHEFAALSLQYIPEDKVNEIYLDVLNNAHNIDEKLDGLRKRGLWGIPQVKSLLDELSLD